MTSILLVGLASGVAALAISRGRVFEPIRSRLTGWRAELASCPLCLGFWLSGAATALQGVDVGMVPVVAWGASWAASTLYVAVVERLAGD
jgi:hypothetical protein